MSALDECIVIADAVEGEDQHSGVALDARAELTALRASVATLTAQSAEQARQLSEAQRLIEYVMPSVQPYMVTQLRAWLAANAPAPQDAQP